MTYGDEQEAASAALLTIVRSDRPTRDVGLLLASRRQAYLAIADRIRMLQVRKRLHLPARARQTLDAARYPIELIADVHQTMAMPSTPDLAPSEILTTTGTDPVVAAWQGLARHLTVGNADLRHWADEPLQTDRRRAYLVADLATTMDGLVLADQRLATAGHLTAREPDAYLQARLAMGNVARVTSWRTTDSAPDHAISDAPTVRTLDGVAIALIRGPSDFAFAQRNLARMMRPIGPRDSMFSIADRHGLHAARAIASGQVRLASVFGDWAERRRAADLAASFRQRSESYRAFNLAMKRLVELRPRRSPYAVAQQSEMVQQVTKHGDWPPSLHTLAAIEAATHEVAVNVGRMLRPEAIHRQNLVVLDESERAVRPITNSRERFVVACRRLADDPAISPSIVSATRHHRDRLAMELSRPSPSITPPLMR